MTKLKNTTAIPAPTAPTAAQLADIAKAAQTLAGQRGKLAELIAAAGEARKDVRDAFRAGYMVGYMRTKGGQPTYTLKQAKAALAGCGAGRTVKGKLARSVQEDKALSAAGTALSEVLKMLKVKTTETRGGNRGKGNGKPQPQPQDAVIPTAPTAKDAMKHLDTQLASLLAYIEKHEAILPRFYGEALATAGQTITNGKAAMTK